MICNTYPLRIQSLRDEIIREIPRVPNNRASRARLEAMHTSDLILAYLTWRMRLIPAKPRFVQFWSAGIDKSHFATVRTLLLPLLSKVASGKDLTPHLSYLVNRKGIVVASQKTAGCRDDKDMMLTRMGLHHFHIEGMTPGNPKGRSKHLIFAEVTETTFTVIALTDHDAFNPMSPEGRRFHDICHSYIQKDMAPGTGYMMNPVMSSGHSLLLTIFSNECDAKMKQFDPLLDDPDFIEKIYADLLVERPKKPKFSWYFDDLKFGLLETKARVFFSIYPFFSCWRRFKTDHLCRFKIDQAL